MSFFVKCSKYISVPILTEWLNRVDLLLFDASIVNRSDHEWLLSLMTDYSSLVHDRMLLQSSPVSKVGLLELCGWYRRFGLPVEVLCPVRISMFDFTLISKYNWMSVCEEVLNRAVNVDVEFGMYDLNTSVDLLFFLTRIRSLTLYSHNFDVLKYFEHCTLLTSVVINSGLRFEDRLSLESMCHMCPLLESIEVDDHIDSFYFVLQSITVHCKELKKLKCRSEDRATSRNAFIFAFHSVSNNLTDIDWEVFDDKDSLVLRTRLWYKGSKLKHLNLMYDQLREHSDVRSIVDIADITCPSLISSTLWNVNDNDEFDLSSNVVLCLREINFFDCANSRVTSMCSKCSALQTLCIDSSITITNSELLAIVQSCPLLMKLVLDCKGLSEGYLALIAPHIRNVTVLALPYSIYTNLSVEDCAIIMLNLKLQSLDVEFYDLQSAVFCSLLKIPTLTRLHCSNCSAELCDLSDSLADFNCTNISSLGLNMQMNDINFISLMSCCPNLTNLFTDYNASLTAEGLRSAAHHCKKLRKICVSNRLLKELGDVSLHNLFPRLIY